MRRVLFLVLLLCPFLGLNAQKIENVRATANGDEIIVTYDLVGDKEDQHFKVKLFSSHNQFTVSVQQVSGDVGDNIAAGKDKRVSWNAKAELKDYKGDLSFEVHADLVATAPVSEPSNPPATSLFVFNHIASVKRGGNLQINWNGGSPSENVKMELLKNNATKEAVMNSTNMGSYTWSVPSSMKPGTYQLKVTGHSGSGVSEDFSIKHKVPTLVKVAPAVLLLLFLQGKRSKAQDLPVPPDPKSD